MQFLDDIIFGTSRRFQRASDFQVKCEEKVIDRVSCVKYLGVHLDACLNGSVHVQNLLKVCASRMAFLYRNSYLLDFDCRRILCSALIQPCIDYCCSAWYSSLSVSHKKRLDVLQRKMVRFVYGLQFRDHVSFLQLHNLSWLSIPHLILQIIACLQSAVQSCSQVSNDKFSLNF